MSAGVIKLMMLGVALAAVLVLYAACDGEQRDRCRQRGGQVEQVYGARPGWVCVGDVQ